MSYHHHINVFYDILIYEILKIFIFRNDNVQIESKSVFEGNKLPSVSFEYLLDLAKE